MVERYEDWPKRLSNYLAERKNMPFEWGVNDCMAFVAKGVEAITGTDFFPDFSNYTDEISAFEMLSANGGAAGIISKCLGSSTKDIMKANRGDVVLFRMPEITAGIVDDSGQAIALVSKDGLLRLPLSKAYRVWKV